MADHSAIEWTDATWNPITGCAVVSPGCTNCYAMALAGTRLQHHAARAGLTVDTKAGPVWNGQVRFNGAWLTQPLKWRRPRRIFVCAHGDLFAEGVPDAWIDRVFAMMALCPHHTFQVLTKRAARMRAYLTDPGFGLRIGAELMAAARGNAGSEALVVDITHRLTVQRRPLGNVWLGVSAEDQARADARVPDLLATPAAVRFVSAEPLLGPIDFEAMPFVDGDPRHKWSALTGQAIMHATGEAGRPDFTVRLTKPIKPHLDWIIVGGESGPKARPMHPDWARQIRDACTAAGVAFHFKQWGTWAPELDREVQDPDWRRDYSGALSDRRPDIAWLNLEGGRGFHGARFHIMRRLGKRAAGRHLDGLTHDAFPEVAA